MLKQFITVLIISISCTFVYSQDKTSILIDSLTFAKNEAEKVRLSNKIAYSLKDSDWKRTLNYLEYSEKEARKSNSGKLLAEFYVTAGDIYYDKDILDIALKNYLKALKLYDENTDESKKYKLENDIAVVFARMNNKDKALYYFKRILRFYETEKDSVSLAQILNNIGNLYLKADKDSSETYFNKSLEIINKLNDNKLYAYIYTNLGHFYGYYNDTAKARLYFDKAINTAKNNLDKSTQSMVFQLSSQYFYNIGKYDSAIFYAKKTINILDNDKYNFGYLDAVKTLYKSYIAIKDYANASNYFEVYDKIIDSINIEEKAVNIERLKLETEYAKKEQQTQIKENKRKFTYIIIALSLVSGLLILLIIILRYRSMLIKERLEKKLIEAKRNELNTSLELKNKMLTFKAMTEIHKTEIIQSILEDLKDIKHKAVKKETQNAIDYIAKRLKNNIDTNAWKEFEISFEQVHESFYNNLNKKHPDLTSGERRLCSLLKLNLTSKEIAQITGQSFKSVENARTRLRKKLGLTNTKVDLIVYLSSFD